MLPYFTRVKSQREAIKEKVEQDVNVDKATVQAYKPFDKKIIIAGTFYKESIEDLKMKLKTTNEVMTKELLDMYLEKHDSSIQCVDVNGETGEGVNDLFLQLVHQCSDLIEDSEEKKQGNKSTKQQKNPTVIEQVEQSVQAQTSCSVQ